MVGVGELRQRLLVQSSSPPLLTTPGEGSSWVLPPGTILSVTFPASPAVGGYGATLLWLVERSKALGGRFLGMDLSARPYLLL